MCRSIKVLRSADSQPDESEVRAAALQFVRKISGYRHPSQVNTAVFEAAVEEITAVSRTLLASLLQRQPAAS
ncbi:MAG: DUF2277 domain-containing protein [Dehalococcoidia bacterium]|nr:DUF2277 domain-containing protein [Dehalococcoidia bacterium]